MDLGATSDLTAVSLVWVDNGRFHVDFQAWVPEAAFKAAPKHVRSVYDLAAEEGHLRITEGDVSDHNAIYDFLLELAEEQDLQEIAFDSWSAIHLTSRLTDAGLPMVRYDQSMKAMSPASKEVELMASGGTLQHLGKPFFNWCLSNCEVYTDVNDNIKVRKGGDPALKIDPIVAMIMAVGRATANGGQKPAKFTFFMD
jgi:phage terminase large subunit-like protein